MNDPSTGALRDRSAQDPEKIRSMFDRISPTYDLLNRILTFGIDRRWRRKAVRRLIGGQSSESWQVLDMCCGTGDMTVEFARQAKGSFAKISAVDFSPEMLRLAERKLAEMGIDGKVGFRQGDAEGLEFPDECFDRAMVAFGIRNVRNIPRALSELRRVLKAGGSVAILEFSTPQSALIKSVFNLYFRHILPRLGSLISGDAEAYRYLNRSAEAFPSGEEFASIIRGAGFAHVDIFPMSFGLVTLYLGYRE